MFKKILKQNIYCQCKACRQENERNEQWDVLLAKKACETQRKVFESSSN